MKIQEEHKFHGAALIQIAEHPRFTAINPLVLSGKSMKNFYRINDKIAVYLRYANTTTRTHKEHVFTFNQEHFNTLHSVLDTVDEIFIVFVCAIGKEICCVPYFELLTMKFDRDGYSTIKTKSYSFMVTVQKGKQMRLYQNQPGTRNTILDKSLLVKRKSFPDILF